MGCLNIFSGMSPGMQVLTYLVLGAVVVGAIMGISSNRNGGGPGGGGGSGRGL